MDILDFCKEDYRLVVDCHNLQKDKIVLFVDYGSIKKPESFIREYFKNPTISGHISLNGIDFSFGRTFGNPTLFYIDYIMADSIKKIIKELKIDMQKIDFFSRKINLEREIQKLSMNLSLINKELDSLNLEFL